MMNKDVSPGRTLAGLGLYVLPFILFWVVLFSPVPDSFSRNFYAISSWKMFVALLVLYYLAFSLDERWVGWACLSLTMILMALALSYVWTSGFSDNTLVGGLVPYKDSQNYYISASSILDGLPPVKDGKYILRPLFPSFMSSMLLLTGHNLKIALAIVAQLGGIGFVVVGRKVRNIFGTIPATIFAVCLYLYFHSWVGYAMSETLGIILGCVGFALLLGVSAKMKPFDLALGLFILLMALSARAGAFFIIPMLALWTGWVYRAENRISLKVALYVFIGFLVGYLLVNSIYSKLLDVPPGNSFGNFSYTIYGQVSGGAGWYSAITDLGTNKPSIIYREAYKFFLAHPFSIVIGFAKSYRDFFFDGNYSILPFSHFSWQNLPNIAIWAGATILLLRGLYLSVKNFRSPQYSLLIFGFIGIFLSIPFLPPIDGGTRFYASTMPFYFALMAVGSGGLWKEVQTNPELGPGDGPLQISRIMSWGLIALTFVLPFFIYSLSEKDAFSVPVCQNSQKPFVIEVHSDSYIDLVKTGSLDCGTTPEVCVSDFQTNNTEITTDDFYQKLLKLMDNADNYVRIVPALDLVEEVPHYFYITDVVLPVGFSDGLISGCADHIKTKYQSIYYVESIQQETR